MATDTYWQLEKEYYTISTSHDFIIRVIEYANVTRIVLNEDGTAKEVKEAVASKVHEFKVKRGVLTANSAYFNKSLFQADGQPTAAEKLDLHNDQPGAIEVWLKILHASDVHSTLAATSIKRLWDVLATAFKYGFDPNMAGAKAWFGAWYDLKKSSAGRYFDYQDYQSLLFPLHTFDHAEGFQQATKYLADRSTGHITERKPDGFTDDHLRLDSIVIQQLNAARGRLKTILHRNLYRPIERLLRYASCNCKAETLYAYELALIKTGAWPLETAFLSSSIHDIINKLANFDGSQVSGQNCRDCGLDYQNAVTKAVDDAKQYFDGLCLDCMDASKPKLGSDDKDYWNHANLHMAWDNRCRISHKQPTWYFSFMGRRAKMIEWNKSNHGDRSERGGRGGRGSVSNATNGVAGLELNE